MENPAVQTGAEVGEAAPSMELAERLLKRRAEPLGVIDVRQGQRHYARTAGWVAQRFALLDHWKTRYGVGEDAATANAGLVFANPGQPRGEPAHTPSSSIQLARAVRRTDAPQPGADPAVSASLSEQFRVRRRNVAPASSLQDTASPEVRPDSGSLADVDKAPSVASGSPEVVARSQTERGAFRAVQRPAITPQAAPAAPDLILPQLSVKAAPETAGRSTHEVEYPVQRKATLSPAAISQPEDLASGPRVLRRHSETPLATAATPQRTLELKEVKSHSETPSARAAAPVQTVVRVSRMEATPEDLPLRLQRKPGAAATELPVAREAPAPKAAPAITQMPLSDSSAFSSPGSSSFAGAESADSISERTGPVENERAHPTSVEIRGASSWYGAGATQPAMIWRRSVEGSSSSAGAPGGATGAARSALPLAISATPGPASQAQRQITTAESTSSTSAESAAPAPPAPTAAASEIDVARLAEQVSRLLARQLVVERERRGRGGWR